MPYPRSGACIPESATKQDADGLNVGGTLAAAIYELPDATVEAIKKRKLAPMDHLIPIRNESIDEDHVLRPLGLYKDTPARDPFATQNIRTDGTVMGCAKSALARGAQYFGVENGGAQCRIGTSLAAMAALGVADVASGATMKVDRDGRASGGEMTAYLYEVAPKVPVFVEGAPNLPMGYHGVFTQERA